MLQITEDTPPDMLAGAMDLTVHLPTGISVKMSVERSTPMMDLLVQITTNYHLQLSGYTLQALGMAPSKEQGESILPYKPNTPIGALDTQHIRVISKSRSTAPVSKNVPPGHQPFESTFRLKVHLPRNQLYVTRVSQSVLLEDIMKKVCEEKNLDPVKYEFRHPANLDEILDSKLTLSDYAITEIFLVQKGSVNQVFSSGDIMSLRKEEERRQMHNKTGGGVFNLIFRRGKSSTGSLSSENRSISPTHSDDSRSVSPPGVQQQLITVPEPDKPKPPQRKRRPAPKPPAEKKGEPCLTICHSRNSSDSSGYHEASILSDNNTSLPRRPKSAFITEEEKNLFQQQKQSTSSLSKLQSKSTSSLAFTSRKKKSAPPPPPPPVLKSDKTQTNLEEPSPVVASQPCTLAQTESHGNGHENIVINSNNPKPKPRIRTKAAPDPRPRSLHPFISENDKIETVNRDVEKEKVIDTFNTQVKIDGEIRSKEAEIEKENHVASKLKAETGTREKEIAGENDLEIEDYVEKREEKDVAVRAERRQDDKERKKDGLAEQFDNTVVISEDIGDLTQEKEIAPVVEKRANNITVLKHEEQTKDVEEVIQRSEDSDEKGDADFNETIRQKVSELSELQKQNVSAIFGNSEKAKPPEVVALHPKPVKKKYSKSYFDSYTRKRGFQIGSSLLEDEKTSELSTSDSISSALNYFDFVDEIDGFDVEMFTGSLSGKSKRTNVIINQLHGMHELETMKKNLSGGSLRSVSSFPGFVGSNMKKWSNLEDLDDISLISHGGRNGWVIGDTSDAESVASTQPVESLQSLQSLLPSTPDDERVTQVETPIQTGSEKIHLDNNELSKSQEEPHRNNNEKVIEIEEEQSEKQQGSPKEILKAPELETDWHYQLPSPPRAFRDSSPVPESTIVDSVVTSPELFEKLKDIKDNQVETVSDNTSVISEEEKPILNKLSLENLEKRKSLVYNRELATSLKMQNEGRKKDSFSSSILTFEKTYDEVKRSSPKEVMTTSTLPNFKITTYNNANKKIDIFEDDTIRSGSKKQTYNKQGFPLQKNYLGSSMDNISIRKNTSDRDPEEFQKPLVPKTLNVFRSESFSRETLWVPNKPVTRSKSHLVLNKRKDKKDLSQTEDDSLMKSNSLFDVSGLSSLGVIKSIQNKLNTPRTSMEQLDKEEPSYQKQPEIKAEVQKLSTEKPIVVVKSYQYKPPAINMSTWSERPKNPICLKDDPDYKFGGKDVNNSKLIVSTVNNDVKSNNSVKIINKDNDYNKGVIVRVSQGFDTKNIPETMLQNSRNVVIKIGEMNVDHEPISRKPLKNVNTKHQRPHSIAFGSDFDMSRVPVVRSVELKKPYKNTNTSVTQINQNNNTNTWNRNDRSETKSQIEPQPIFRVNSYLQKSSAPVVRGFRSSCNSWNQPDRISTLPAKPSKNFMLNAPVPFSQANLRKTETVDTCDAPPPAPRMPKNSYSATTTTTTTTDNCGRDPKEQLLQAIRDFGGKKGLRAVKA